MVRTIVRSRHCQTGAQREVRVRQRRLGRGRKAAARARREMTNLYLQGSIFGAKQGYRAGYQDGLADAARALQGTVRR